MYSFENNDMSLWYKFMIAIALLNSFNSWMGSLKYFVLDTIIIIFKQLFNFVLYSLIEKE